MTKGCASCGETLAADTSFCGNCGASVAEAPVELAPPPSADVQSAPELREGVATTAEVREASASDSFHSSKQPRHILPEEDKRVDRTGSRRLLARGRLIALMMAGLVTAASTVAVFVLVGNGGSDVQTGGSANTAAPASDGDAIAVVGVGTLATLDFPNEEIEYPADWLPELRLSEDMQLIDYQRGEPFSGGPDGLVAKARSPRLCAEAAEDVTAAYSSAGWDVQAERVDTTVFLAFEHDDAFGSAVLEPDPEDADGCIVAIMFGPGLLGGPQP